MDSSMEARQTAASGWFEGLAARLRARLETIETAGEGFQVSRWNRGESGGGETGLLRGEVFEKAGVHTATVRGMLEGALKERLGGGGGDRFWASGVSVIVHPRNPNAPAAHMNTRFVVTDRAWFGGGADLTPMLDRDRRGDAADTRDFHAALESACAGHAAGDYDRFKAWCDEYFYLPHRGETRGTGGIFYDHLNTGDHEGDFAFARSVGEAFAEIYPRLVERRMGEAWSESDREEQLRRRGFYAEFNLLYDRGTRFGLETGGNVESILSSLPPLVRWP